MSMVDDARIIEEFKNITVNRLEEVILALPALIPQNEEDKKLFRRGLTALNNLTYDLKHATTPREISRHIDVHKVLRDFDEETIRTFSSKLGNAAKESVNHLSEIARTLQGDDEL